MSFPWGVLAAFALPVIVLGILYVEKGRNEGFPKGLAVIFKTAATLCCACFALYLTLLNPTLPKYLIYAGLLVDAAADFMLCYDFFRGVIFFGAGHMLYCAACVLIKVPGTVGIAVCGVLFALCFGVYYWKYDRIKGTFGTARSVLLLIYALLECLLAGFVCNQNALMIAGAALFILSDILLALGGREERTKARHYAELTLYWAGLMMIASSVFLIPVTVML